MSGSNFPGSRLGVSTMCRRRGHWMLSLVSAQTVHIAIDASVDGAPATQCSIVRMRCSLVRLPRQHSTNPGAGGKRYRKRRSRSELVTTNSELNAIAAPANSGESRPTAATGMRTTL